MDIIQVFVPGEHPNAPAKRAFVIINGNADELMTLMKALEDALHDGPQVVETKSMSGTDLRIVVDRFGQPVPKN